MGSADESVDQYLEHEDEALVRQMDDVAALVREGCFHSGAVSFGELRRALEAHLWLEERVLLPALCCGPGARARPLRAVLQEHQQIRDLCREISQAISRWDQPAFDRPLRRLASLLRKHQRKERQVVRAATRSVGTLGQFLARAAEVEGQERRASFEEAAKP